MFRQKLLVAFLGLVVFGVSGSAVHAQLSNPDVNRDGSTDCLDIDAWNFYWHFYDMDPVTFGWLVQFLDVTEDGTAHPADLESLIHSHLNIVRGNANCDGIVNANDLNIVVTNLGGSGGWGDGDFNGDGLITSADLQYVINNWLVEGNGNWNEL